MINSVIKCLFFNFEKFQAGLQQYYGPAVNSHVHMVVHYSRNYFSRKCKRQSVYPHDKYRNQKTQIFINWWRQLGNEYQKYRVTSIYTWSQNENLDNTEVRNFHA